MGRMTEYFTSICLNVSLYFETCEITEPDVVVLYVKGNNILVTFL